jgi:hypothetical protein
MEIKNGNKISSYAGVNNSGSIHTGQDSGNYRYTNENVKTNNRY